MLGVSGQKALLALGCWLRAGGYSFVTPTPATHARVNARAAALHANSLRGAFGWNQPFSPALLPPDLASLLLQQDLIKPLGNRLCSRVRLSTLGDFLFAHSAYPTTRADAVFFGPDTYRFARLIRQQLQTQALPPTARIVDIGCGAGPGGLVAATASRNVRAELVLADINPHALDFARVNAELANFSAVSFKCSDVLASVEGDFDLIVANPPYLVDGQQRVYRHGGGPLGTGLAERIVAEGLQRLTHGGRLMVYTGVPIIEGTDPFLQAVRQMVPPDHCSMAYEELDPDVFGEELDMPAYAQTDRIAAVSLVVQKIR